jgi:autotransporter-associated beta strand protein
MKPALSRWGFLFVALALASPAPAQTTWTNAAITGMWTNQTIWTGPVVGYPNGVDSVALFNGASLVATQSRGITNNGSITNGSLVFVGTAANNTGFNLWTNNATARLYLDVSSGSALIANSTNTGTGANQVIMPMTLLDALVVSNNGTLNLAGDIDNSGNTITFKGNGTTALSRPMAGVGQVELQSGVLSLSNTNAVGPAGSPAMIASGGAIVWGVGAAGLIPKALVISNSVALVPQGGGSASFGWQNGISGPGQLTISNQVAAPASGLTLWSNSYAGGTILSNTIASIQSSFAFGSGTVTIREGTRLQNYQTTAFVNQVVLQGGLAVANVGMYWTNSAWDMDGGSRLIAIDHGNTYTLTLLGLTNGVDLSLVRRQLYASGFTFLGPVSHTGLTLADGVTIQLGAATANSAALVNSANVILNNGAFQLDNRGGAASRVRADAQFVLTNSSLQIVGPGTAGQIFTQQIGAVSLNFGANTLTVTNRGTFLVDSMARAAGATLNVNGTNAPTVYAANAPAGATNGIVPWMVLNHGANGFAGWSGSALAAYSGYTNVVADDPTANVKLAGASIPAMTGSRTINSLYVSNSGASLNLGGYTLTIASGGLLFGPDPTPNLTNGVVNFGSAEGVIYNNSAARIYAGLDGQAGITKSGGSQLFLYGTNTYAGDTRVNQGSLILQNGALSNGGNVAVLQGATLQLLGSSMAVNSLLSSSNWLGAPGAFALSSGSLTTRSNSYLYAASAIGQSPTDAMSWTMLGGSNFVSAAMGTNLALRATGAGTTLVVPGIVLGAYNNSVVADGGATFSAGGSTLNVRGSNNVLRADGAGSRLLINQFGVAGYGSRLVLSNGAAGVADRGVVGTTFSGSADNVPYTNSEMIVSASTLDLALNAANLGVGTAAGAMGNRLTVSDGGAVRLAGGNGAVGLSVGTGATSSYNVIEVSGGSLLRFFSVANATPLLVGNTNAGGTGNALIVRDGSTLDLQNSALTNLVRVVGAGNAFSNIASTFQVGGGGTVGIYVTNTPGTIVFTNTVLSWVNRADGYVTPLLAGTTFTNVTWQGDNGFMLNNATNASGLAAYTFDSVANTSDPTQFQRLLLTGSNSLWRSAALTIASGGELIATNAVGAAIGAVLTNAGTVRTVNSVLTYLSNVVQNGGAFITVGGTNQFARGLTLAGNSELTFTSGSSRVTGVISNGAGSTIRALNTVVTFQDALLLGGTYVSDPSTNIFATNVTVAASGALQGSNGDLFVFWRDLALQSTNRDAFNLAFASLLFTNGASATNHALNLTGSAALDLGPNWPDVASLATNFSVGALGVAPGNSLRLLGDPSNALYVGVLDLGGLGTNLLANVLDLDVNMYYDASAAGNTYLGGQTYTYAGWSGSLIPLGIPIPEPSVSLVLAAGAGLLLALRRRSRR